MKTYFGFERCYTSSLRPFFGRIRGQDLQCYPRFLVRGRALTSRSGASGTSPSSPGAPTCRSVTYATLRLILSDYITFTYRTAISVVLYSGRIGRILDHATFSRYRKVDFTYPIQLTMIRKRNFLIIVNIICIEIDIFLSY